jgi:4-hydroxy-4-methyl-2-oxoglutarate aldolase
MRTVIVTDVPRPPADAVEALAGFGVATVHEAQGRTGCLGPEFRPIVPGVPVAGPAVTALCWPGDNLMVHAAVEQCRAGDVLVVVTTSPCTDGMFGELLATSLRSRGVVGAVLATGVRDTADLRRMRFPVWSRAVCAQGTVKATAGAVNVDVTIGGQVVRPGDAIVADDDGVVVVPRESVVSLVPAASARVEKEAASRAALESGQLGLDLYGLRPLLARLGVTYEKYPT